MRLTTTSLIGAALGVAAPAYVYAWGAAGHEIVSTIAEIHLHPPVLAYIQSSLLPSYANGHLAPIASWADRIKRTHEYAGWSGVLHYASWEGDHPPDRCAWMGEEGEKGQGGWHSDKDVLNAIANYTTRLEQNPEDADPSSFRFAYSWVSFNFLTHFLGDVHQPLHLTSRERGGNGDFVLWEGRRTNLHSLWDGLLIARTLREQRNYTTPLPSQQIERALTGRIYDPYIRLLLWEGVRSWYRSSLSEWMDCSATGPFSTSSASSTVIKHTPKVEDEDAPFIPTAAKGQLTFSSTEKTSKVEDIACPIRWATETHRVTCELGFPEGYDEHGALREIGGESEFWRGLKADHSLARLLLQGGLRLAAVLNTVLAEPAKELATREGWIGLLNREGEERGKVNLGWIRESDE
ncbi:hypothetical protein JCM11251_002795 [Rhodosporidiobolus azoricus]